MTNLELIYMATLLGTQDLLGFFLLRTEFSSSTMVIQYPSEHWSLIILSTLDEFKVLIKYYVTEECKLLFWI